MYKFGLQHQRRPERNRNRALQNGAALGLGLGAITRAGLSGSPVMRAALSYARLSQLATLLVGGPAAATPLTPTTACTRGPCGPGNEVCADAAGNEAPISRFVFHLTDHGGCKINDPNGPVLYVLLLNAPRLPAGPVPCAKFRVRNFVWRKPDTLLDCTNRTLYWIPRGHFGSYPSGHYGARHSPYVAAGVSTQEVQTPA
jgi:hypothetical protein